MKKKLKIIAIVVLISIIILLIVAYKNIEQIDNRQTQNDISEVDTNVSNEETESMSGKEEDANKEETDIIEFSADKQGNKDDISTHADEKEEETNYQKDKDNQENKTGLVKNEDGGYEMPYISISEITHD